jgi:FkbM family methyltransferase
VEPARRFLSPRGGEVSAEERCLSGLALEGRAVFDIGAFDGAHTLFFASRVGPSGRVVTFEPHPANRATILSTLERYGMTNVDVRDVAVGRASETMEFVYPDDLGRGSADPEIKRALLADGHCRRCTFPVRTLDSEIAAGRVPEPDLVKVDVEGLEYDVLLGMRDTVARSRPALFIEIHGANDAQESANYRRVAGWLIERGYRVRHVESGRRIRRPNRVKGCYAGQHLYCV